MPVIEILEGFDDRDWNGVLSPELAKRFKLVGIKVSQGRAWEPRDRAVLQRQWKRANSIYGLLRLPFHYLLSPVLGQDAKLYGKLQALNFHTTMKVKNKADVLGWGELPPFIDVENRFVGMAGAVARAKNLKACLEETILLWDRTPGIYTATWYWDRYMHTEFVKLVPKYWEIYDLWEADPPPETYIAGWGDTNSIQQIKLDGYLAGYGSGGIDLDETTQAWIDKVTGGVIIPTDCNDEVSAALAKQEEEHLVDIALAKHDAYNTAIIDGKNAVKSLYKE